MVEGNGYRPTQQSNRMVKNPYVSKWNILFDKSHAQWLCFRPQEGHKVYPCYACRDMFGSKGSFLDHVNRRGMLITYRCIPCQVEKMIFYNPCACMLHARKHFTIFAGTMDLDNVSVAMLPIELAGFFPHPNVPLIYDVVEDDATDKSGTLNTRFYSPVQSNMGNRIVNLTPNVLLFHYSGGGDNVSPNLVLRAISTNIPRCHFVPLEIATSFTHGLGAGNNVINGGDIGQLLTKTVVPPLRTLPLTGGPIPCGSTSGSNTPPSTTPSPPQPTPTTASNPNSIPTIQIKDEPTSSSSSSDNDEFLQKASEEPILPPPPPPPPPTQTPTRTISTATKYPTCTECHKEQRIKMMEHLLAGNRPSVDTLKCATCNYVAPTVCSLSAHRRIHQFRAPFVCPECGRVCRTDVELMEHMDAVCFHMAKQVRFRCSGRNCGKIFAQSLTFSSHFLTHMPSVFKCTICNEFFFDENDFNNHSISVHEFHTPGTFYKCLVCKETGVTYTAENYMDHVNWHCTDPRHRVYVYICKYCRSYFRSSQTYAIHLLRCVKKGDDNATNSNGIGMTMTPQIIGNLAAASRSMGGGSVMNRAPARGSFPEGTVTVLMEDSKSDIVRCVQCKETCTLDALVEHMQSCKGRTGPYTAIRDVDHRLSTATEDKKKRKRPSSVSPAKAKRPVVEHIVETVELPTVFDGTYICKICDFKETSREKFQEHIVSHRHVSTAYQCMDCGECFLVRPSLIKHLRYYHNITDTDAYFGANECCDKEAVSELVNNINKVPGETSEPVAEHQCRVCRLQCASAQELSKHFRVHGMAFINIRNKPAA